MDIVIIVAILFFATKSITKGIIAYSIRNQILDIPNERSSHTQPTPRGGGIAFVLTILLGSIFFYFTEYIDTLSLTPLLLGGGMIAFIGWLDDKRGVSAIARFAVHCLAAFIALTTTGIPQHLPVGSFDLAWGFAGMAVSFLAIIWLTNSYNFMDGIDGLAAGEAVIVAGTGALICSDGVAPLYLLATASVLGFLLWNWPPAKIFMGDSGSGFLGYFFSITWLYEVTHNPSAFFVIPILLAAFATDSTLTLLWRMYRGEQWYKAHRLHVYQILSCRFGHKTVAMAYILITAFWLTPLAWVSQKFAQYAILCLAIAYLPLVGAFYFIHQTDPSFAKRHPNDD